MSRRGGMPFEESGFLSSDAPWVAKIREDHKPWFDLISKINRLAAASHMSGRNGGCSSWQVHPVQKRWLLVAT